MHITATNADIIHPLFTNYVKSPIHTLATIPDSVLLLRIFRNTEKSPVILCPTGESNPRHIILNILKLDSISRALCLKFNYLHYAPTILPTQHSSTQQNCTYLLDGSCKTRNDKTIILLPS
ncbi:hypothetical protein SFRURICE_021252 [Spodoptera frugiperda]|nr:hypothetical protein SFRURICE_021252 [Spodoptera frugiperda]